MPPGALGADFLHHEGCASQLDDSRPGQGHPRAGEKPHVGRLSRTLFPFYRTRVVSGGAPREVRVVARRDDSGSDD